MCGWFSFDADEFRFWTRYPAKMVIYDAEAEEFVPMLTSGGLQVNSTLHPWVITRVRTLQNCKCKKLDRRIRGLRDARAGAQQLFAGYRSIYAHRVQSRDEEIRARGTNIECNGGAGVVQGNSTAETERIGGTDTLGTGLGVGRSVTFSTIVIDDDGSSNDSDYVGGDDSTESSEDEGDEMDLDELEEDELEEDVEEAAVEVATIFLDLTNVSGMSVDDNERTDIDE